MYKKIIKTLLCVAFTISLTACNGFFEKDNTPAPIRLTPIKEEFRPRMLWSVRVGNSTRHEYLKLPPTIDCQSIFTASSYGCVTSVNKATGQINWKANALMPITSGVGAGEGIVVVGGRNGQVVAFRQSDGATLWRMAVHGAVLAQPTVRQGIVIIKTANGHVRALSPVDGHEVWSYEQSEPNLILRAASAPIVREGNIIVGFSNGTLVKLGLSEGQAVWEQTIAIPEGGFAIQRMIDIDADPIIYDHHIYAATYQGKIAALNWSSGNIRWSQNMSSYTGMAAIQDAVFISDTQSLLWAYHAESGFILWRSCKLQSRDITGPAIMGSYIVVGDKEGYLHWLEQHDGHLAARVKTGTAPIFATPIVENNILYVLTSRGYLEAFAG